MLSSMAIGTERDCVFNCVITTVRKWNLVVDLEIWAFIAATLEWCFTTAVSTGAICAVEGLRYNVWISLKEPYQFCDALRLR